MRIGSLSRAPDGLERKLKIVRNSIIVLGLSLLAAGLASWWIGDRTLREEPKATVIADVSSERLTTLGSVVGYAVEGGGHAWLGVPFAAPPTGELRWRPPRRAATWTEPLDALAFGSPCVQLASPMGGVSDLPVGTLAGVEDCLYLNIWSPRFDAASMPTGEARLPVMVWIHGGGNTIGHAGDFYDGSILATQQRVVVVSLNYRLGPFGWFAHPSVFEGMFAGEGASGNFGTLDLIAGLGWVRENIEFFGGDPGNVTIFGESAGGTNVLSLLVSPLAEGLFHRAITQSGSTASVSVDEAVHYVDDASPGDPRSAREQVLRLLVRDGSASDRVSARLFADGLEFAELAEYLRAKTPREIMSVYREGADGFRISVPRVIRDGVVLPREPWLEVLADPKRVNSVPVILGSNRDEFKLFLFRNPEWVTTHFDIFFRVRDGDRYDAYSRLGSDLWKARGVDLPAAALAAGGARQIYAYRFDWDEEPSLLGTDYGRLLGAGHGMEIPFVFGHFKFGDRATTRLIFNDENRIGREFVSDAMLSYWAEFAYTGSPGRGRDGSWPLWESWSGGRVPTGDSTGGSFVVLDTPEGGGIRMSVETVTPSAILASLNSMESLARTSECWIFSDLLQYPPDWRAGLAPKISEWGCGDPPQPKSDTGR